MLKGQWNGNSGTTPGFRSTTERCKFGTGQGSGQPIATMWREDPTLPFHKQGVTILGTLLEHPAFVEAQLSEKVADHATLLERIPQIQDLQCAWLLFCAASRANYLLRVVHPEQSFHFAVRHDAGIRGCLEQLLHIPVSDEVWHADDKGRWHQRLLRRFWCHLPLSSATCRIKKLNIFPKLLWSDLLQLMAICCNRRGV